MNLCQSRQKHKIQRPLQSNGMGSSGSGHHGSSANIKRPSAQCSKVGFEKYKYHNPLGRRCPRGPGGPRGFQTQTFPDLSPDPPDPPDESDVSCPVATTLRLTMDTVTPSMTLWQADGGTVRVISRDCGNLQVVSDLVQTLGCPNHVPSLFQPPPNATYTMHPTARYYTRSYVIFVC